MPIDLLPRRQFLISGAAAFAVAALGPLPALALTEAQARQLVDSAVADINRVIASGQSESAMMPEFERIFATYADVPVMARYALGADARAASPGQLQAFTQAFQRYIARKYGKRFRDFIGAQIVVNSARQIKNGYEVRGTAKLRGESPVEVVFLVSDRSGRNLFFNLFVEGVNLLLTERTEIGAMLDQQGGNIDNLIAALQRAG
ncbi:MlaC/ttg2D family ABC transporter substrate-binding protein [Pontibaca methylaminivorans]|uniref:Phospholipid transport system substrate-binding protein n=1 Tax=Pontibaca methylaminivorans TaxID=515897 RepID=A0A1R3WQ75_9RHOB|nr:ABC transporter substrate-binding protein [Pontibaca methylaminivorans]SIT79985.1 phospholipid transport system substrate-binding protein [Pontibaca methylaminivorans]